MAGPQRRTYQLVMHEVRPGWTITKEWEGYQLEADTVFSEVDPGEFCGLFLPGGRAPEYLRYDSDLMRLVRHFFETDKPVGSVCHGVEIIARAGVIEGRKVATVDKCRFDVEICGGIFIDAPVVIDGNLVSGRTYHDNGRFVGEWIKLLKKVAE